MTLRSWLLSVMALVGVLGAINAGYLVLTAMAGEAPNCNFIHGCDIVAASPYSRIFGIPLSAFGVFFYTTVTGFALWGLFAKSASVTTLLLSFTVPGFLLSLYFLYLQMFIIGAYCEYCLFSLFDATVLFLLSLIFFRMERKKSNAQEISQETNV